MTSHVERQTAQRATSLSTTSPISTLAFDWVYLVLVFLVTAGIYLDGWSHASFGPDQSVFSEYHLLFYSSLVAIGLWLFGTAFANRQQGYQGLAALPAGYKLSALGLIVFGLTGVVDLGGHALFGFEVDIEALFSPSHIGLFLGWALICVGPTRAALHRQRVSKPKASWASSFGAILPALLAWVSLLNVLAFVSMEFFATSQGWMLLESRTGNDYFGQLLGITGVIIQTGIIVGSLSYLLLNFRLPLGSFSLFFLVYSLYDSVVHLGPDFIPVFFLLGLICDLLYVTLKPSATRLTQFHLFNVLSSFVLWASFYAYVFAFNYGGGVWYTPYIWSGSIVQGMVTALLLTLLLGSAISKPLEAKV